MVSKKFITIDMNHVVLVASDQEHEYQVSLLHLD